MSPKRSASIRVGDDLSNRPSKKANTEGSSASSAAQSTGIFGSDRQDLGGSSASKKSRTSKSARIHRQYEITDPELSLHDKLTSEEGQLEENPYYTPEQAREAAQREYNRRNAARGRIRRKCLLSDLQDKYATMEKDIETLKQENAALKAEMAQMKQAAPRIASEDLQIRQPVQGVLLSQLGILRPGWMQSSQPMFHDLQPQNPVLHSAVSPLDPAQQQLNALIQARARAALNSNPY